MLARRHLHKKCGKKLPGNLQIFLNCQIYPATPHWNGQDIEDKISLTVQKGFPYF